MAPALDADFGGLTTGVTVPFAGDFPDDPLVGVALGVEDEADDAMVVAFRGDLKAFMASCILTV